MTRLLTPARNADMRAGSLPRLPARAVACSPFICNLFSFPFCSFFSLRITEIATRRVLEGGSIKHPARRARDRANPRQGRVRVKAEGGRARAVTITLCLCDGRPNRKPSLSHTQSHPRLSNLVPDPSSFQSRRASSTTDNRERNKKKHRIKKMLLKKERRMWARARTVFSYHRRTRKRK